MGLTILSGLNGGQVLQRLGSRGADVIITGNADHDGPIRATLFKSKSALKRWNRRNVGRISGGKFRLKLSSLPVGGPYRLLLQSGEQLAEVAPFFVGDVWLLAGQSNMEGVGNMIGAAKPHPLIFAFSMRRQWRVAEDPLHILDESPDKCHAPKQCSVEASERLRQKPKGVGVGVFFAREMLQRSGGVPQGLICTAHGGTSMRQWDPKKKPLNGESLYASMLMSVEATGQPVAGLLWYQGESDANPDESVVYTRAMRRLVAASRRDLGQRRLPWITVQIARVFTDGPDASSWNSIQEQQRRLPNEIKFLETVAAIDLPLDDPIHIAATGYPRLALRLARMADRMVYGNRREVPPPGIRSIRWVEVPPSMTVEVSISNAVGGLRSDGEPRGFSWVNANGVALNIIYKTEIVGDKVKLYMNRKPEAGLRLYYGHGYAPACNITDARDFSLPVAGPLDLENIKPMAITPFMIQWKVSQVVPDVKPLDQVELAAVNALRTEVRMFSGDMVNDHSNWENKNGHAFFARV
jgi:hypothetical protein